MKTEKAAWPALLSEWLISGAMFLANICLAAMLIMVFINVLLRYFFREPIHWGDEIMTYLMILVSFFGFGYNLMKSRHIRMTALVDKLSPKMQNYVSVFNSLIAMIYFVFLLLAGIFLTKDSFEIGYFSVTTGLPIGPWQSAMCVGLVVLLTASLWFAIRRIKTALGN